MSETATATVSALYYYPVKSTRGIATRSARGSCRRGWRGTGSG